jgi:DNA-directed RNA polymerase subunit M/transcription elongation factor TFIIS
MKREEVIKLLENKYSNKISKEIEKEIFQLSERTKILYQEIAYEKLGEFISSESITTDSYKKLLDDLKSSRLGYDSSYYQEYKVKQLQENNLMINPPTIVKSIYKCKNSKCLSDKTYSWQAQTRSADEGMTTFVSCSICGQKYKV